LNHQNCQSIFSDNKKSSGLAAGSFVSGMYHHLVKYLNTGERSMNLIQAIRAVWNELSQSNPQPSPEAESPMPQVLPPAAVAVKLPNPAQSGVELPPEIAKLPTLPQLPPQVLNEALEEHREKIWKYLYKRVEKAVVEDLDEIYLWRIERTHLVLFLNRAQYEGCLDEMKKFFIKTEEYEYIPFCNELIDKIKVNEVIRASR